MNSVIRLTLVVGLAAAACSAGPTTDDFVESLAEARPELGRADAECIIEDLRTVYSDDDLSQLISDDSTATDAELEEFAEQQFSAVRSCELADEVSPSLVGAFAEANALSAETAECAVSALQSQFGLWELADQFAAQESSVRFERRQLEAIFSCGDRTEVALQLRPQLEDQGIGPADAECVAGRISTTMEVSDLSVLYTGESTDRFYALFLAAVTDCGALPDDLG